MDSVEPTKAGEVVVKLVNLGLSGARAPLPPIAEEDLSRVNIKMATNGSTVSEKCVVDFFFFSL